MLSKKEIRQAAEKSYNLMKSISRDKDGNLKTLEGVIRSIMLKSPDNFQYRDDALNLIYCTLGTGIEWNEWGCLGDSIPNNYINMSPDIGSQGIWSQDFGQDDVFNNLGKWADDIKQRIIEDQDASMIKAIQVIDEIDIRIKLYRKIRQSWYPISWYNCHLCCPENVQTDFLDGALETIGAILDIKPDFNTEDWIKHEKNKRVARHMKMLLLEQKKS
jgi:hypothetical protein